MRIVHITAGTGSFHCGVCLRDHALVSGLRRAGHQALMLPLYLPAVLEQPDEEGGECPIFFGGINVYLQQKSWLFRHTPAWLDRWFNGRSLLNWAAGKASMTKASDLGELTLSMLEGERGLQRKELRKLIAFLKTRGPFDVVSLSNALLLGLAEPLGRELGAAVVCTLQGEDTFLDSLGAPWAERCWIQVAACARQTAALIPVSAYHGAIMAKRFAMKPDDLRVVHNGIDLDGFAPAANPPVRPAIGYLARMTPGKGLTTLVEAFILLKRDPRHGTLRLRVAGACVGRDEAYVAGLKQRLAAAGVEGVDWLTNVSRDEKQRFLRDLTVLSVPATYGETFGLYVIEALASGVPVVEPTSGAFPELIAATGGGVLCRPDDAASLAETIATLLADPERTRALGDRGRSAVVKDFSADAMAAKYAQVCTDAIAMRSTARAGGKQP